MKRLLLISALFCATAFAGHPAFDAMIDAAKKETGEVTPKELKKMLESGAAVVVFDAREIEQRAEGDIPADKVFAVTRGSLEGEVLNKLKDKNATIVTFCRTGWRGALAAQTLKHLGYANAKNLKGGIKAWAETGYAIETGMGTFVMKPDK